MSNLNNDDLDKKAELYADKVWNWFLDTNEVSFKAVMPNWYWVALLAVLLSLLIW